MHTSPPWTISRSGIESFYFLIFEITLKYHYALDFTFTAFLIPFSLYLLIPVTTLLLCGLLYTQTYDR